MKPPTPSTTYGETEHFVKEYFSGIRLQGNRRDLTLFPAHLGRAKQLVKPESSVTRAVHQAGTLIHLWVRRPEVIAPVSRLAACPEGRLDPSLPPTPQIEGWKCPSDFPKVDKSNGLVIMAIRAHTGQNNHPSFYPKKYFLR